ncbi:hypothetical protein ACSHWO_34625 [Streptomyces sp. HUAS TT3]|uniref:hypothetical protein n=1 Tax=Streptomyces sp. HUAS TT3 TaxID=3447510 RepID=UPI003F65D859
MTLELAGLSDDEVARILPHLDDADTLRVMAETHRHNRAGTLPGVRADLVHLSDDELATRYRNAPADQEATAAKAARSDLLARTFTAGTLRADLGQVDDDTLAGAMPYPDPAELLRIAEGMGRRDEVDIPQPADTGNAVDDLLTDRQALAQALAPAPGPDGWGALADDAVWAAVTAGDGQTAGPPRRTRSTRMGRGSPAARPASSTTSTSIVGPSARDTAAMATCSTGRQAQAAGHTPVSLFSGPARIACARVGRAERVVAGKRPAHAGRVHRGRHRPAPALAEGARKNGADHQAKR